MKVRLKILNSRIILKTFNHVECTRVISGLKIQKMLTLCWAIKQHQIQHDIRSQDPEDAHSMLVNKTTSDPADTHFGLPDIRLSAPADTYYRLGDLFVCLFVFVALRPKSTALVIAGRSVHLTTLFSWASLNKQLTSNRAHTFACN